MNIQALISSIQADLESARQREHNARAEVKSIISRAKAERRDDLTSAEDIRCDTLLETVESAVAQQKQLEGKLARAETARAEDARADEMSRQVHDTPAAKRTAKYDAVMRIGGEQQVYRAPAEHGTALDRDNEHSFISDLYMAQVKHDPAANARLERHGRQVVSEQPAVAKQVRSFGTSVVPGFAPPQYLVDDFALFARQGRVAANLVTNLPLEPEGMSTNIPRVTTLTQTGVQATENSNLSNADPASTLLTNNVVTIGGYVILSRQAVERATIIESVVVSDLSADYNKQLDLQLLTGSGSSGQHLGILNVGSINSVVYTDATPTVPELLPKCVLAMQSVWQNRFAGPTAFLTSPRTWAWILAQVDSQGRPLVEPSGVAMNPAAIMGSTEYGYAPAGSLFNQPVFVDANCPDNVGAGTNESRIICANWSDMYLFEDSNAPVQMHFEAPSAQSLGVLLVCYGYSSFAAGRQPKGISVLSGTGMIIPSL